MAVVSLPGWFDDSERDDREHNVAALGGCVGTDSQWRIQDESWQQDVLNAFGLDYLHMKELFRFEGKFEQFKDKDRSLALSRAIIGTFKKSGVHSFGSAARLKDLRRFNNETKRHLAAYPLNIYACMFMIRQAFRTELNGDAEAVLNLDKREGSGKAADTARHYAKTDPNMPDVWQKVLVAPLPKGGLAKKIPALQAADFIAWEIRKDVEAYRDFWDSRPDGESNQALGAAHTEWVIAQERDNPWFRGIMRVFVHETPVLIWRWTYNVIRLLDGPPRSGIWTTGLAKRPPASGASS